MRTKHYSRVPVYAQSIHNIRGIVYAQDVLQVPDSEASQRTLETLMRRDVYFVPESKLGRIFCERCRRTTFAWQSWSMSMAASRLGYDRRSSRGNRGRNPGRTREAGNRAGDDQSYIVFRRNGRGRSCRIIRNKTGRKGIRTMLAWSASWRTHSTSGETVDDGGLRFEVLEATDRKVERVRITAPQPRQLN